LPIAKKNGGWGRRDFLNKTAKHRDLGWGGKLTGKINMTCIGKSLYPTTGLIFNKERRYNRESELRNI
jgi:hypothetical protein